MRDIKFRGKRLDNGEWVYGFLIQYLNGWFICNFIGDAYQYEVDPSTVGQFTGLKDKNGREIYEGDITKVGDLLYQVVFKYAQWKFDIVTPNVYCNPYFYSHAEDCKIIGNIYDNPELLKEGD